jgi:hypothetical protein
MKHRGAYDEPATSQLTSPAWHVLDGIPESEGLQIAESNYHNGHLTWQPRPCPQRAESAAVGLQHSAPAAAIEDFI